MVMEYNVRQFGGSRAHLKGSLRSRKPSPSRGAAGAGAAAAAASVGKAVLLVSLAIAVSTLVYAISTAALKGRFNESTGSQSATDLKRIRKENSSSGDSSSSSSSVTDDGFLRVNCNPFDQEAVACCGHRGAPMALPGNTVPAFLEAFEEGATCVEMDVMLTSDSLLAVGHSRILNELLVRNGRQYSAGQGNATAKMGSSRSRAEDMSLADLKRINLGPMRPESDCADCNVPSLEEVFEAVWRKPVQLVLELKVDGAKGGWHGRGGGRGAASLDQDRRVREYVDTLVDLLEKLWSTKLKQNRLSPPKFRMLFTSFDWELIDLLEEELATASPLLSTTIRGVGYIFHPKATHDGESFGGKTNVVALHSSRISDSIRLWHGKKYTLSWVVDDMSLMKYQVREGVNAIITNDPSLCKLICKAAELD